MITEGLAQYSYALRSFNQDGGFTPITSDEINAAIPSSSYRVGPYLYGGTFATSTMLEFASMGMLYNSARSSGFLPFSKHTDMFHRDRLKYRYKGERMGGLVGEIGMNMSRVANYIGTGKAAVPGWGKALFQEAGEYELNTNPGNKDFTAPRGLLFKNRIADRLMFNDSAIIKHFGDLKGFDASKVDAIRDSIVKNSYKHRNYLYDSNVMTATEQRASVARTQWKWSMDFRAQLKKPGIINKTGTIVENAGAFFKSIPTRMGARIPMGKGWANTQMSIHRGTIDALRENGIAATQKEVQSAAASFSRSRVLVGKFGMGTATAVARGLTVAGIAAMVIPAAARGLYNLTGRAGATLSEFMKADFGSSSMIDNARLATERQRQMQAIQNSGLNARSLMGNEAAYYR